MFNLVSYSVRETNDASQVIMFANDGMTATESDRHSTANRACGFRRWPLRCNENRIKINAWCDSKYMDQ